MGKLDKFFKTLFPSREERDRAADERMAKKLGVKGPAQLAEEAEEVRRQTEATMRNRQPTVPPPIPPAAVNPARPTMAPHTQPVEKDSIEKILERDKEFEKCFDKLSILFILLKFDARPRKHGEQSLLEYLGFDRAILAKYFYAIFGKFNVPGNDRGYSISSLVREDEMADAEERRRATFKAILLNEVLGIANTKDQSIINGQLTRLKRELMRFDDILPARDESRIDKVIAKIATAERDTSRWLPHSHHIALATSEGGYLAPVDEPGRTAAFINNLNVLDRMIIENGGNPMDIPTPNQQRASNPRRPGGVPPVPPSAQPQPIPQPRAAQPIPPKDIDLFAEAELPQSILDDSSLPIDGITNHPELVESINNLTKIFDSVKTEKDTSLSDAIDNSGAGNDSLVGSAMKAANETNIVRFVCRHFNITPNRPREWARKIREIDNEFKHAKIYDLIKPKIATPSGSATTPNSATAQSSSPQNTSATPGKNRRSQRRQKQ